jgi:hypothetical protein
MIKSRDPNARIIFKKKRDDLIRRIFSAHVLIKDPDGFVVPTNTIDIDIPFSTIEEFDYTFKLGSIVIYDIVLEKYRFLRADEFPEQYISDPDVLAYAIPYLLEVRLTPPRISYYDTNVAQQVSMNYEFMNINVNYEFILSNVKLTRNPLIEQNYILSCQLLVSSIDEGELDFSDPSSPVKIIGAFKDGTSRVCWFELKYDGISQFFFDFSTTDTFNTIGQLGISANNMEYPLKRFGIQQSDYDILYISESMELILGVLYTSSSSQTDNILATVDASSIGSAIINDLKDINLDADNNYDLAVATRGSDMLQFFKSMNDVMHTQAIVKGVDEIIKITEVPLVGLRYFYNTQKNSYFYSAVNGHCDMVRSELDRLENNFDVDLKFYNTYGKSVLYDTENVHISIDMSIKLRVKSSIELESTIKMAVKLFVIATNDEPTRKMSISNLNTFLENTFPQISYIIFNGINGLNIQAINYLYTDDEIKKQQIKCAPEFLNVALVDAGASALRSSEPNIKITYI